MSKNNYTMSQKKLDLCHFLANFTNIINTTLMSITLGTENLHLILNYIKAVYESYVCSRVPAEAITRATLTYASCIKYSARCEKDVQGQCCLTRLNTGKTTRTSRPVNKWGNRKHHFIGGIYSAAIQLCWVGWPLHPVNSRAQFPVSVNQFKRCSCEF